MFKSLLSLTSSALENLAGALRDGALSRELNVYTLSQITGSNASDVFECLTKLQNSGMTSDHIAFVIEAISTKARTVKEPSDLFELVLSGPAVAGVPTRDTSATILSMVESAEKDIMLVGYVLHRIKPLFGRIAERMNLVPMLGTKIFIDIPRKHGDTSLSQEIIRRFVADFVNEHWPFHPRPELYYDKRSLENDPLHRSSLHAKCVVVDRRLALITSANLTEAAQERNIELGIEIRHEPTAERICRYFEGLVQNGILVKYFLSG